MHVQKHVAAVEVRMRLRMMIGGSIAAACVMSSLGIAQDSAAKPDETTAEQARTIIVDGNAKWGKARVEYDKPTMDTMLAKDFYVQIGEQKISRETFLDQVSTRAPNSKLVRFDVQVLTVSKNKDHWDAVIAEKLEIETKDREGKDHRVYSLWVTRDGWKQEGDKWVVLYSEAVGSEFWRDKVPPVANWAP